MAFEIESGVLVKYIPEDGETEITIPEGVTAIGDRAFKDCSDLTAVSIPKSVTSIGEWAFDRCMRLKSIVIPEGVTNIRERAFRNCTSLTGITLPESVTSIGAWAFNGCGSLNNITIPEGVTSIGNSAFYGCRNLTSITLPKGIASIESWTFDGCESLNGITIPAGVTSIGHRAFEDCRNLSCITIPESVTSIGSRAFGGCDSLTSMTLQNITFNPAIMKDNDLQDAMKMLRNKDFATEMSIDPKCIAVIGFYLKTGDTDAEAFVKRNISRIMSLLITHNNPDAVHGLLTKTDVVTVENIDQCIDCAIEQHSIEILTQLLHYKAEVLGYNDPAAQFRL